MISSTGTWVTFGGQISDEVSQIHHSAITLTHEAMLALHNHSQWADVVIYNDQSVAPLVVIY